MARINDGTSKSRWSSLISGSTIATNKWYNRGDKYKPTSITIHSMEGNDGAEEYAMKLSEGTGKTSYNYCIGSDGTIWGSVPEEYGSKSCNSRNHDLETINIVVATVNDNGEITQEAWDSLVRLSADVGNRYGFELSYTGNKDGTIHTHAMYKSGTDCPGAYLTSQLSQLADEANARNSSSSSSSTSGSSESSTTSSSTSGVDALIASGVINLEFSYGYNDGQMSEVHRGVMTEYDVDFNAYGSTLTIEGVSKEFVSFRDPKSVTYKGMTIEEIVRSIADEEGWIVEEDSIEPIADVKESIVYSLTTGMSMGNNIYDGNNLVAGSGSGSGTISDGTITATQQKVIDSARSHTTGQAGWCAKWVSQVFDGAGLGYPGGDACDMYDSWCTSSNKSDLKPGMIIAIHPSPTSNFGHVGIYIGNDTIRHNAGGTVKDNSVDEWISTYTPKNATNIAKWGWINGKDLSAS